MYFIYIYFILFSSSLWDLRDDFSSLACHVLNQLLGKERGYLTDHPLYSHIWNYIFLFNLLLSPCLSVLFAAYQGAFARFVSNNLYLKEISYHKQILLETESKYHRKAR